MGGGALKRGRTGEGSRGGDGGEGSRAGGGEGARPRRAGGGGGGAPLFPVFWGLRAAAGGAFGGGGGGGAFAFLWESGGASFDIPFSSSACFCSIYALIKSEFSAIWSSVMPMASSSSSRPFHDGSIVSKADVCFRCGLVGSSVTVGGGAGAGGGVGCLGGIIDSAGAEWVGAEEDRCP